jgi:hypothetical protein
VQTRAVVPGQASSRINRSTVHRATAVPSQLSTSQTSWRQDAIGFLVHTYDRHPKLLVMAREPTAAYWRRRGKWTGDRAPVLLGQHAADWLAPNRDRCSRMNLMRTAVGGRAPPRRKPTTIRTVRSRNSSG